MKYLLVIIILMLPIPTFAKELTGVDENSDAYQRAKRLIERQGITENSDSYQKVKKLLNGGRNGGNETEQMCVIKKPFILIFISSSMPKYLLKEFAEESFKLSKEIATVNFILRGVPEMGLEKFREIINPENKHMTIRIDPFLFNRLEIETVPVVIVDRKYAIEAPESLASAIHLIESDECVKLSNEL